MENAFRRPVPTKVTVSPSPLSKQQSSLSLHIGSSPPFVVSPHFLICYHPQGGSGGGVRSTEDRAGRRPVTSDAAPYQFSLAVPSVTAGANEGKPWFLELSEGHTSQPQLSL